MTYEEHVAAIITKHIESTAKFIESTAKATEAIAEALQIINARLTALEENAQPPVDNLGQRLQ